MKDLPPIGSENWAYYHALSHIKQPVAKMREDHARVYREPATVSHYFKGQEAVDFLQQRIHYLIGWAESAAPVICRQLMEAWGATGKEVVPAQLQEACKDYCDLLGALIDWEIKVASANDPTGCWTEVFSRLRGATCEWFEQLAFLPDYVECALNGEGGQKKLNLNFKSPPAFDKRFCTLVQTAYNESVPFWKRRPFATGALAGVLISLAGL